MVGSFLSCLIPDCFNMSPTTMHDLTRLAPSTKRQDVREKVADMPASQVLEVAQMNIDHVIKYMDVASLLLEAASDTWNRRRRALSMPAPSTLRPTNNTNAASSLKRSPASVPSMTREEKRLKVQTELRERGESTKTG